MVGMSLGESHISFLVKKAFGPLSAIIEDGGYVWWLSVGEEEGAGNNGSVWLSIPERSHSLVHPSQCSILACEMNE